MTPSFPCSSHNSIPRLLRRRWVFSCLANVELLLLLCCILSGCDNDREHVRIVANSLPVAAVGALFAPTDPSMVLIHDSSSEVSLWEAVDTLPVRKLFSIPHASFAACFSRDRIAVADFEGNVRFWSLQGREVTVKTKVFDGLAQTMVASANGTIAIGSSTGKITVLS